MKHAVILCAGAGTKIWPYAQIRCKAMIPVSNKPVAAYAVESLSDLGFEKIVLVCNKFAEEIAAYFRDNARVCIVQDAASQGTASSLLKAQEEIGGADFLALYGDVILSTADLQQLIAAYESKKAASALVYDIRGRGSDVIGCQVKDGKVADILGHSRGDNTHAFAAFALPNVLFDALPYALRRFTHTEVGMMPPAETYLEDALACEIDRGLVLSAVPAQDTVFDLDKPWHILQANYVINKTRCAALTQNELDEGAQIDPTACINGFVKLGKNSRIGRNVIIDGSIIVGDNTKITNGAILQGNIVIGNGCAVRNACFVSEGSTIGNECIVSHAAELEGIIMRRVFLYHYMEFYGIIGENTDLGAATVCGSLRFDDGSTIHRVKSRREFAGDFGDATFLGDYVRTGVNAILMPGVKVGPYSVVGAGVLLGKDLPDHTMIYTEQTLHERKWGSEVYGW